MRHFKQFILDSGRWGVASDVAALVSLGFAVYEHVSDKPASAFWLMTATVILFCLGAYAAWDKKRAEVENLEKNRVAPKLFLRYEQTHDTDFYHSGFFVQVEGERKAFDVSISSDATVGRNHKRIVMLWEVPKAPIGTTPVPIHAQAVQYQSNTPHPFGGISGRQIHRFFEEKKDFPNEFEATLTYKDVDGRTCAPRKFKITSERDFRGNFEIGCIPLEGQAASRT
jgi:hypothetical protein